MVLKETILRDLRNTIASGTLKPRERITETAICRQYGISRTPVREILKQLEKEGLVRISPNAGARVADFSVKDVSNIYEIFITLEGAGARFACREASNEDIRKLEECQFIMEKAIGQKNLELVFELNSRFHMLITEFTGNPYLIEIRRNFSTLMSRFGRLATFIPRHLQGALEEHPKIIDAIVKRNAALAEFLAREHIEKAKAYMSAYVEQLQEKAGSEKDAEELLKAKALFG
jgi:DNA-binding GntR family transcriptional regulator